MSEIANITRLLLHSDNANKMIGAQAAVGLGLAEHILEHYERELNKRLANDSSLSRFVKSVTKSKRGTKPISHLLSAVFVLKTALGIKLKF